MATATANALDKARALEANVARVIVGKAEQIRLALVPLLGRGHLLLEDVPGIGKTTLAKTIARSLDADFKRIQFTPDLLPLDVTGAAVYNQKLQEFEFKPGPVFANVLLADEINRATPRTQSSLLECMEESQVSADGRTHRLPDLFFVIATLNPVEQSGTFPLPETQLDRFMLRLRLGYPSEAEESEIFDRQSRTHPLEALAPVLCREDVAEMRRAVPEVRIDDSVKAYAIRIVRETRRHPDLLLGAGPRGTLAFLRAAQAFAFLSGGAFVTPDHLKHLAAPVLGHRIVLKPQASLRGVAGEAIVKSILERVPVPVGPDERL
ncbi:MAG: MoxR family ATPase [Planctomycetes bacterium]|nr:MoxR family ATPase [Planctomycetota bacterium]